VSSYRLFPKAIFKITSEISYRISFLVPTTREKISALIFNHITNPPQPHPSAGEGLPPPLGGGAPLFGTGESRNIADLQVEVTHSFYTQVDDRQMFISITFLSAGLSFS
jgi:hypothetical protein